MSKAKVVDYKVEFEKLFKKIKEAQVWSVKKQEMVKITKFCYLNFYDEYFTFKNGEESYKIFYDMTEIDRANGITSLMSNHLDLKSTAKIKL